MPGVRCFRHQLKIYRIVVVSDLVTVVDDAASQRSEELFGYDLVDHHALAPYRAPDAFVPDPSSFALSSSVERHDRGVRCKILGFHPFA